MFIFWRQAGPARAQLWAAAFVILPLHGPQMLSSFTQLCVFLLVFIFFSPTYTCRSTSLPTLLHTVVPALAGAALRVLTGLSRDREGNRQSANTGEQNLSSAGSVVMLSVIVAAEPPSGVAALSPLRSGNQQRAAPGARGSIPGVCAPVTGGGRGALHTEISISAGAAGHGADGHQLAREAGLSRLAVR